jgi:hypothetical protein
MPSFAAIRVEPDGIQLGRRIELAKSALFP